MNTTESNPIMRNGYKWFLLLLLGCAYFFHQVDRAIFGVLTPEIQADLGLDDVQLGWINTLLSWTIAVVTPLAGLAGNRFSRKWIITFSLAFWSLATCLLGLVGNWSVFGWAVPIFISVLFLRSLATGGGDSFYGPSAMALLATYHRETRSIAFSIHQAALYIGLMTSGLLAVWTMGLLGTWRHVFVAFGLAGFLLGVSFVFLLKDGTSSDEAQAHLAPAGEALKSFFLNPSALLATSGFVAIVFANNALLFWGVKFAAQKFADAGVTRAAAGTGTMFWHHACAFAAILVGGLITDRFVGRAPRFRLGFQIVSLLCGAPALVYLAFAPTWPAFLVAASLYGVFRGFFEVNTHASVFDVVPARYRSSAVGCMLFLAFFIGGLLSGWMMGALSRAYGLRGFEIGFATTGAAYLLAAGLMAVSFFVTFRRDRLRV